MTPPLTNIYQDATVRLIPTKYYIPPFLKPLAEIESELPVLLELESKTDESLNSAITGSNRINFRDDALQDWGQTHINIAFSHRRPEGNRFNTTEFGAWYASFDDLTAIDEVSYHRTRELMAVNFFEDEVIYQALLAKISGEFHDLRQVDSEEPFLGKNPEKAYPFGQLLARDIRTKGSLGLVYPSQRKIGGTNIVSFHPHSVQNLRPGARWRIIWDGSPDYTITTEFGD